MVILGHSISSYSRWLVEGLAQEAHLGTIHITRTSSSVEDQAGIFYRKHVENQIAANYKNPEVAKIIAHARSLRGKGSSPDAVISYMVHAIHHAHGGLSSISRHLGTSPLRDVFDIAHYSLHNGVRHNHMSDLQARAFLEACRKRMSFPIARLGHSAELGFKSSNEFKDEQCFHMEVLQPVFDRLEGPPRGIAYA